MRKQTYWYRHFLVQCEKHEWHAILPAPTGIDTSSYSVRHTNDMQFYQHVQYSCQTWRLYSTHTPHRLLLPSDSCQLVWPAVTPLGMQLCCCDKRCMGSSHWMLSYWMWQKVYGIQSLSVSYWWTWRIKWSKKQAGETDVHWHDPDTATFFKNNKKNPSSCIDTHDPVLI